MSSEKEPDPQDSFATWRPPLTEDQIRQLQPLLNSMAASFARCEADRLDYVQQSNLRLVQSRNWTNWYVAASSAMADYWRHLRSGVPAVLMPFGDEEGVLDPETRPESSSEQLQEMEEFRGLGLSEEDRLMAVSYWVDGLLEREIAERLRVSQMTISRRLARVRKAVAEHWCK